MATIQSTLSLNDKMSTTFSNITRAMHSTLNAMRAVKGQDLGGTFDRATTDIIEAEKALADFNNELKDTQKESNNAGNALGGLEDKVLGLVSAYVGLQTVSKLVGMSDEYTQTSARLDLINDGLQTTEELQNKIFQSAQRARGSYTDMSSAVAKLGLTASKAFKNNDEIIAFTELLNKNFVVGGASATEQAAAMYQLTQAMGSGKLQGDEYRSIIENAPLLAKAIEDYMRNVQGATGTMKDWASEGMLTADVIKAALFSSADDINAKFESMPMTWGQVWTGITNELYQATIPLLKAISFLAQHWEVLEPIVIGAAAALGVYIGALLLYKTITGAAAILEGVKAAATMMSTGATFAATAAQHGFNAALLACPLTWILLIIIAVIAALYAIVAAINKTTGSSLSATGIIVGALSSAVAFIWNLFLGLLDIVLAVINFMYNKWAMFANFFANLFNDPIGSIIHLFGDMADNILGIVESIAKALDKVFGSNLAGAVQGWRSGLDKMVEGAANKYGNGSYEKVAEELNLSSESLGLSRWAYGDAFSWGYDKGSNLFSGSDMGNTSLEDLMANVTGSDSTGGKAVKTTTNDDLLSDDDIQLLLDVATRDYKLNYQQVTPQITLTFGDVRETADVDQIIDEVANRLEEIYDGNLEVS